MTSQMPFRLHVQRSRARTRAPQRRFEPLHRAPRRAESTPRNPSSANRRISPANRLVSRGRSRSRASSAAAARSFDSADGRPRGFDADASQFLASRASCHSASARRMTGIYSARDGALRSILALFTLILVIGTLSAARVRPRVAPWVSARTGHPVADWAAGSQREQFTSLPLLDRDDEIGALAAQLRTLSTLETLVAASGSRPSA